MTEYTQDNDRIAVSRQRPVNNLKLSVLQQQESRMEDVFSLVCVKLIHITSIYYREDILLQIHNAGAVFRLCSVQLHGIEAAFRESERVCRSP
jgi:hypothetical protein